MFALGFLARGDVIRDDKNTQEMPIVAVETISTAFMGMTVGCAKCHDHMFDPITQNDFYAMKALFDPLVVKKVTLATPAEILAQSKALDEAQKKRAAAEAPIDALIAPYKKKLYDDRVAMLPADVQAIIRKPEKERTVAEQKIADDYFPVLRIDADKIQEIMPPTSRSSTRNCSRRSTQARRWRRTPRRWRTARLLDRGGGPRAASWRRATSSPAAIPSGPRRTSPCEPGWPFAPAEDRFPRRPDRGLLRLADRPGKSAVRARGRESPLAMALRRRPAKDLQRFRHAGRHAQPIRSCSIGWRPNSSRAISA